MGAHHSQLRRVLQNRLRVRTPRRLSRQSIIAKFNDRFVPRLVQTGTARRALERHTFSSRLCRQQQDNRLDRLVMQVYELGRDEQ